MDLPKDDRHTDGVLSCELNAALGIDTYYSSIEEVIRRVQNFEQRQREELLVVWHNYLDEHGPPRKESARVAFAKALVALLPLSFNLISQLLEVKVNRYCFEMHFSLFCYLDDCLRLPEALSIAPKVLAAVEKYVRDVDSGTAHAAWMAGHLLGDHWPVRTALPILLRLASGATHVSGRAGALHGLETILNRDDLDNESQCQVIAVLEQIRLSDRSQRIRASAEYIIDFYDNRSGIDSSSNL